ncbi:hypothetical protein [Lentzea sp. NPDC004782]|uniref:hypothetical protein n=1 Tax=Lentzea sp. NPDC004782 TaxID=3154458 RepID=UPI0033AC718D
MTVEEELRGALDVPVPPATTTLEGVLRRGRRRLFVRRAGAVLGTLAVVAIMGFGSVVWNWNQARPMTPGGSPGDWPRASGLVRKPADPQHTNGECDPQMPTALMARGFGAERFSTDQLRTWRDKAQEVLPSLALGAQAVRDDLNMYEYEVTDEGGTGSLRLSAGFFAGSPSKAADEAMWVAGGCQAPRRVTARDGTVYQLYDVVSSTLWDTTSQKSAPAKMQTLHVYRPDGAAFRIDQLSVVPTNLDKRRESLPLTESQLVRLGPAIAGVA